MTHDGGMMIIGGGDLSGTGSAQEPRVTIVPM
jgi:hypothetical protein